MHKRKFFYLALLTSSIIYITTTLLAPLAPNRFNLTTAEVHLLQITIALPVVIIWAVAVYGAENFKRYSKSIEKYPDGKGMDSVATGVSLLVLSIIIINGLIGSIRPWALRDGWLSSYTIIVNLVAVVVPLVAYYYLYRGTEDLKKVAKIKKISVKKTITIIGIILVVTAIYIKAFADYKYKLHTPDPALHRSFYQSDAMILLTLVLPNLIGWTMGLKAAFNLSEYQLRVKGVIYKLALERLVTGTILVIAFAVVLQLVVSFSTFFAQAGLSSTLAVVYSLIFMYALGFLFIASGTKKLNNIEKFK